MGLEANPGAGTDDLDDAVAVFDEQRRRIFGIAYRMLGTVADAEDIVQETWIRWQGADRTTVLEPAAFLATIATRLSINATQSAHARRETYIGPWLPEPVNTDADPALGAERGEALQFAILLLLEKLTPTERAAYVLREALRLPVRAHRRRSSARRSRARGSSSAGRASISPPSAAPGARDAAAPAARGLPGRRRRKATWPSSSTSSPTTSSATPTATASKLAARIPVIGRGRVAKFVAAFSSHFWTGKTIGWVEVNGQPAATLSEDGDRDDRGDRDGVR